MTTSAVLSAERGPLSGEEPVLIEGKMGARRKIMKQGAGIQKMCGSLLEIKKGVGGSGFALCHPLNLKKE